MKLKVLAVGATDRGALSSLIESYAKRIKRFSKFEIEIVPDIKHSKNLNQAEQRRKEADQLIKRINPGDTLILLDEKGKSFSSIGLANWLQQQMNASTRCLVFVIGGPYGLDPSLRKKANGILSLSEMTFSHQMVRLFLTEQLYRALTILNNQPYHNE